MSETPIVPPPSLSVESDSSSKNAPHPESQPDHTPATPQENLSQSKPPQPSQPETSVQEADAERARQMLQDALQEAQFQQGSPVADPIPTPQSLSPESKSAPAKMSFELPKVFATLQKITSFLTAPLRGFMNLLRSIGRWIVAK